MFSFNLDKNLKNEIAGSQGRCMFSFVRNHQMVLQSNLSDYMSCQHPLLLPPVFSLHRLQNNLKHNLDPIAFLFKPFQWLPTALEIKFKVFNIAWIIWCLALYSATASPFFPPPCSCIPAELEMFPFLVCEALFLFRTFVHEVPLPG